MKPKVSIVMPIFNVSRYLDQALECAKRQTLRDIEIICVNDGSTDNSLDIVKKWAEGDDRFVIIDKVNEGYGVAMNTGMAKAKGEYIAILEPDDIIPLNMYEDLYETAKENDLDIVKGDFYSYTVGPTGNVALRYMALDKSGQYYGQVLNAELTPELTGLTSYTWTGIYRRKFIEENNISHNTTPGASFQDIGFFWKTTVKAKRVMLINKPYYWYRQDNPDQSIKRGDKVYFRDQEFDRVKEFLANNEDTGLWERFRNHYYAGRFRRSLVNIRRISDEFTDEYLDHIRRYFSEAIESGEFDLSVLSESDRSAFNMMMGSAPEFLEKYHRKKGDRERENNTNVWEVLKEERAHSKQLRKEVKQLRKELDEKNSKKLNPADRTKEIIKNIFKRNR